MSEGERGSQMWSDIFASDLDHDYLLRKFISLDKEECLGRLKVNTSTIVSTTTYDARRSSSS